MFPIKKGGLGLQNLLTSSDEKSPSLQLSSTEPIRIMKGESEFSTTDNLQEVKEERSDDRKIQDDVNKEKLEGIVETLDAFDRRLFLRAK